MRNPGRLQDRVPHAARESSGLAAERAEKFADVAEPVLRHGHGGVVTARRHRWHARHEDRAWRRRLHAVQVAVVVRIPVTVAGRRSRWIDPGDRGILEVAEQLVGRQTDRAAAAFYAGQCLNGTDLTQIRYAQPDRILSVSPNTLLAASSSRVYRVSDGTPLATVPGPCPVQAFSRDSGTLYCTDAGFLTSFDVRALK